MLDIDAANQLAADNVRLVPFVIHRFVLPMLPAERLAEIGGADELISSGYFHLVHLSRTYDPSRISRHTGKPVAFTSFASFSLRRHFSRLIQWRGPSQRIRSFDGIGDIPSDADTVIDVAVRNERQRAVANAVERLPERLRIVLELRFYSGLTLQEIAERLGIVRERVRQLEARALAELAERLGGPMPRAWRKIVRTAKRRNRSTVRAVALA